MSLLSAFAGDLPEIQRWADVLWAELGGVAPEFAALEQVLARYRRTAAPA